MACRVVAKGNIVTQWARQLQVVNVKLRLEHRRAQVVITVADHHLQTWLMHNGSSEVFDNAWEWEVIPITIGAVWLLMVPIPALAWLARFEVEVSKVATQIAGLPAQLFLQVLLAQGNIVRSNESVISQESLFTTSLVEVITRDARIIEADNLRAFAQKLLAEALYTHPEVGLAYIVSRQASQVSIFTGHSVELFLGKRIAHSQGCSVRAVGEFTSALSLLLNRQALSCQAVVEGGSGIGREVADVELVVVAEGVCVVENIGNKCHTTECATVFLQLQAQGCTAYSTVGFTEEVFRRVPAIVFAGPAANELAERSYIAVDTPQFFLCGRGNAREASTRSIDKDEIGKRQKRVLVVHERVWSSMAAHHFAGVDAAWGEGTHEQEGRCRTWAAVKDEGHGARRVRVTLLVELEEVDVEQGGCWCNALGFDAQRSCGCTVAVAGEFVLTGDVLVGWQRAIFWLDVLLLVFLLFLLLLQLFAFSHTFSFLLVRAVLFA